MSQKQVTRRKFLRVSAVAGAATLAAPCGNTEAEAGDGKHVSRSKGSVANSIEDDLRVVHDHIETIMPLVVRQPGGWFPHRWIAAMPWLPYKDAQAMWDAYFECLRFAYAGKAEYFRDMLANHLHYQMPSGWIPFQIHETCGINAAEDTCANPFVVQSAYHYIHATADTAWAEQVYGKLEKFLGFWETERQVAGDLYCWWGESGMDNDVIFSFFRPRSIAAVSASTLMWMEYRAMSLIAMALGKNADVARYQARADAIRKAINDRLWCEELGCYANVDIRTGLPIVGLGLGGLAGNTGAFVHFAWHSMLVMYPKLAPAERAKRHIENYLLNPEHFWGPHGIRSLSARSEYYNNAIWGNPGRYSGEKNMTSSNWQGPVLFPVSYFVFHTLLNYGYAAKAEELADRVVRVIAANIRTKGCMYENYHSETGVGLYAAGFASFNTLADKMHDELKSGTWLGQTLCGR